VRVQAEEIREIAGLASSGVRLRQMCPIWPEQRGGTPPNPAEKAPSECATNLLILLSRRYQEIVGATSLKLMRFIACSPSESWFAVRDI
jgi:hypothetical protein